jgi:hypothetical protein
MAQRCVFRSQSNIPYNHVQSRVTICPSTDVSSIKTWGVSNRIWIKWLNSRGFSENFHLQHNSHIQPQLGWTRPYIASQNHIKKHRELGSSRHETDNSSSPISAIQILPKQPHQELKNPIYKQFIISTLLFTYLLARFFYQQFFYSVELYQTFPQHTMESLRSCPDNLGGSTVLLINPLLLKCCHLLWDPRDFTVYNQTWANPARIFCTS